VLSNCQLIKNKITLANDGLGSFKQKYLVVVILFRLILKDRTHTAVKEAIEKANWQVTDGPLRMPIDTTVLAVDLGAERLIGAFQGEKKIAIEIKTLAKRYLLYDFYAAFGQYIIFRDALREQEIDRVIYLAISEVKYQLLQQKPFLMRRIVQHDINQYFCKTDCTMDKALKYRQAILAALDYPMQGSNSDMPNVKAQLLVDENRGFSQCFCLVGISKNIFTI